MTAGMKPIATAFAPRTFWMRMLYRCEACGHQLGFALEEGCEGPHDGLAQPTFGQGGARPWPRTAGGRLIVPVPFIAGGCPRCQGAPPWNLSRDAGVLVHVDWERDAEFRPRLVGLEPGTARFHYPDDPKAKHSNGQGACGIPIFPPHNMRGQT